jgi:hypothetical protein
LKPSRDDGAFHLARPPKQRLLSFKEEKKIGQSVKLRIGQIARMGPDNLSERIEKPPDDIRKFPKAGFARNPNCCFLLVKRVRKVLILTTQANGKNKPRGAHALKTAVKT